MFEFYEKLSTMVTTRMQGKRELMRNIGSSHVGQVLLICGRCFGFFSYGLWSFSRTMERLYLDTPQRTPQHTQKTRDTLLIPIPKRDGQANRHTTCNIHQTELKLAQTPLC